MTEATNKSNAPALDKGLDILELLSESSEALSIYDISRALGRTRGELYRVLNRLIDRGYVLRVGDQERVVLGDRAFRLAAEMPSTHHLIELSAPVMMRLVRELGHSSILSIRSGAFSVTIFNVNSGDRISMSSPVGSRMELWDTAAGVAMISAMPKHEAEVLTSHLGKDQRSLLEERMASRDASGFVSVSSDQDATVEIAVPFQPMGHAQGASISTILLSGEADQIKKLGSRMVQIVG